MIVIAYQGIKYSNCYYAAMKIAKQLNTHKKDGNINLISAKCSKDVVDMIINGEAEFGLMAKVNSITGSVKETSEALEDFEYNIIDKVQVPIAHCLFGTQESSLESIKTVYSHPQALLQCNKFLNKQNIESRPYKDTAMAAIKIARESKDFNHELGCLCTEKAGLEVGLKLLKRDISNDLENFTSFILVNDLFSKNTKEKDPLVGCWEYFLDAPIDEDFIIPHENNRYLKIEPKNSKGEYKISGYIEGNNREMFQSFVKNLRYSYLLHNFVHPSRRGKVYLDFLSEDSNRILGVYIVDGSELLGKMRIKRVHEKLLLRAIKERV